MFKHLITAAALCAAASAQAQQAAARLTEIQTEANTRLGLLPTEQNNQFRRLQAAADSASPTPLSGALITVLGGSGDGEASLQISSTTRNPCIVLDTASAKGEVGDIVCARRTITLTASSPLGDGEDLSFATLDRLAGGQKLRFTYAWLGSKVETRKIIERRNALVAELYAGCIRKAANDAELVKSCDLNRQARLIDSTNTEFLSAASRRRWNNENWRNTLGNNWGWALNLAVSHLEYDHFDRLKPVASQPEDFTEISSRRVGLSGGVAANFFPFPGGALNISADYQRTFEAGTSQIICPVVAGATSVRCTQGSFAPPTRDESLITKAELRFRGGSGEGLFGQWAVSPNVSHDVLTNKWAVDVPLYLVPDEDGNLVGGLRAGWSTDQKAVFGVFVGTRFSLF